MEMKIEHRGPGIARHLGPARTVTLVGERREIKPNGRVVEFMTVDLEGNEYELWRDEGDTSWGDPIAGMRWTEVTA